MLSFAILAVTATGQTTFPGSGVGAIPDGPGTPTVCGSNGAPLNITFNVSGASAPLSAVGVNLTLTHTWVADVTATLIAPNGTTHVLFGYTGSTTAGGCGDSSNLAGLYSFSDAAAAPPSGGWWQAAAAVGDTLNLANGTYRSTGLGGVGATNPMPATSINAAFAGVANPNGTWTLRITDGGGGDTGSVSAASLILTSPAPPANHQDPNVDFNGDSRSDYILIREPGTIALADGTPRTPQDVIRAIKDRKSGKTRLANLQNAAGGSSPLTWYASYQGVAGSDYQLPWGDGSTDDFAPFDFNGDGKDDFGVWRPGPQLDAAFHWVTSNDFTFGSAPFGATGDDTSVSADYDGDGKDDLAVFRCPLTTAAQCGFYYKPTLNNPTSEVVYVPWGFGVASDFYAYPGDFDGDGKNDFCIQTVLPGNTSQGTFLLLQNGNYTPEYIAWGLPTDALVPGDYDGDGKSDFAVQRANGSQLWTYIYERDGGIQYIPWGLSASDLPAPGDYDGDGKQDIGVFRWDWTLSYGMFWVYKANGQVETFAFGKPGDYPAALWYVH